MVQHVLLRFGIMASGEHPAFKKNDTVVLNPCRTHNVVELEKQNWSQHRRAW